MVSLSTSPETSKRNFEKAAVTFAASIHEAERAFLYASWFDPAEMIDVACDLSLDHSSFTDPEAQFIFCFLGCSAEFGRQNTISVGECVNLAQAEGIPINGPELTDDILLERERYPGDITTEIRPRGEILKQAVLNRIEARAHLRAVLDLIGENGFDELLERPQPTRVRVPQHLQRRRKGFLYAHPV